MTKRIQPLTATRANRAGPTFVIDIALVCNRHLALCVDQDSREVVGLQMAHAAADAAVMAVSDAVVSYGVPKTVVVGNGPDFAATIGLCQRLGIGVERVVSHNPLPLATERAFRDLRGHLDDLQEVTR